MSARERILGRVRAHAGHVRAHPGRFRPGDRDGSVGAFGRALQAAGGELLGPVPAAGAAGAVAELCRGQGGGRVVATPGAAARLGDGPWRRLDPAGAPHALDDVQIAILLAAHGVAENGAVALSGDEVRPRAVHVLCQKAIVLLDVERIVPQMHAAVDALDPGALAHHHLTWVSGPSKTADIESTLVIGAHGPRDLVVLAIEAPAPGP